MLDGISSRRAHDNNNANSTREAVTYEAWLIDKSSRKNTILSLNLINIMESNDDNLTRQVDEVEALSAIYPEWKTEDETYRTYAIAVKEEGKEAGLVLTLPPEYPATSPPYFLLTAPWMKAEEKDQIYAQFEQICSDHPGESILHLLIENLREFLQSKGTIKESGVTEAPDEDEAPQQQDWGDRDKFLSRLKSDIGESVDECPVITSAEPFTDRKSTFQGHVATVHSVKQVKQVLARLYENRKIAQATHNMYAYRIFNEDTKLWLQDCEDDGEDHAGGRMMHLLQILEARNVLVVVSRWFGGVLLGGDRFKLINNAARDALELGGYLATSGGGSGGSSEASNNKKTKKKK